MPRQEISGRRGKSWRLNAECRHQDARHWGEKFFETNLVLDKELDTLNRSCSGLGDGGRNTAHCVSSAELPPKYFAASPDRWLKTSIAIAKPRSFHHHYALNGVIHTQKVNHKAGHAHETVIKVSCNPSRILLRGVAQLDADSAGSAMLLDNIFIAARE